MNTEKIKLNNRFSLSGELVIAIISLFAFFVVGILGITSFTYSNSVETTYINQVISTSEQALSNYATYTSNVVSLSDAMQGKLDNETLATIQSNGNTYFDEVMSVSDGIKSISLFDLDGNYVSSNSFYAGSKDSELIKNEDWFVSAKDNPLINSFSRVDSMSRFTLSKLISINFGAESAILNISYSFDGIASMIDEARLGEGGHVFIYDNDYQTVYASDDISENELNTIKDKVLGTCRYNESGNSYFIYISTIPKTRWRVAISTNINDIKSARRRLFINASLFTVVALFAFIVFVILISRQITKPLVRLQQKMAKVENLDFQLKDDTPIGGTKEIVSLNKSYATLMNKIKDLAEKVVAEQKEQNKAELKALQNQINPHFLYNTLDSIIYLIDQNENEKAQKMIVALSRFFRISISRGKNIISVKNELDHVMYYLEIQKMRFGETFRYQINTTDEVNSYYVIKLILQPIVENAIVHGIGEDQKDCLIIIDSYLKDDFLCFDVSDNGYGMLPEKVEEIYTSFHDKNIHNGVGLSNVYQRLRLFYGDKADIKIESALDKGTKIKIVIPREEAKKNEEK